MALKLYSGALSLYCAKVEIALKEKQLDAEIVQVPFSLAGGFHPKHPDVSRVNPKEQIPVLIDGDLELFDSTVINEYLEDVQPRPALLPSSPQDRARARLWELKADEVFGEPIRALLNAKRDQLTKEEITAAKLKLASLYEEADRKVWEEPYLVGQFSYADIALYAAIVYAKLGRAAPAEEHKALLAWFKRVGERESVRAVFDKQFAYLREAGLMPAA